MRKLKIIFYLLTLLLAWRILPLGAALPELPAGRAWRKKAPSGITKETGFPRTEGLAVVCGNKRLDLSPDGKIRITSDGRLLAELYNYQSLINRKTQKADWKSHSRALSSVKHENGRFIWNLQYEIPDGRWQSGIQTLEIVPDGKLKISFEAFEPGHADWKLRGRQALWLVLPENAAAGSTMEYNGKPYSLDIHSKRIVSDWKSREFTYCLYSKAPENVFLFQANKTEMAGTSLRGYPSLRNFRLAVECRQLKGVVYLDFRNAPDRKLSAHTRGGIDFKSLENLEMPEDGKNLLLNNSFEQGLLGYRVKHANRDRQWKWVPFTVTEKEAFHGSYSLAMSARPIKDVDYRRLAYGVNLTTSAAPCVAGTYTVSFHAKSSGEGSEYLNFWIPNFYSGSPFAAFAGDGHGTFRLTPQWKRYSTRFKMPRPGPVEIHFNTWSASGREQTVWVDAIQLEKSDRATAYQPKAAEGRLVTSREDNFISAAEKINGRLLVSCRCKDSSGQVDVTVKNFFGEELLKKTFAFHTDSRGKGEIALPLDSLPGKGLFIMKAEYSFSGKTVAYEYHRYAKIDYMNGTHRLKHIFSNDYSHSERACDYFQMLTRYRCLGIGSKWHHYTYDSEVWETEEKFDITPFSAFGMSDLLDKHRKTIGFCIAPVNGSYLLDDPRLLVRDYHLDSGGRITPAYLEKLKQASRTLAETNPAVRVWTFGGELSAKFPYAWWSEEGTMDQFCAALARLAKAFAEGIREGNPKAKVCPFTPNNMRPEGGIAEIDRFLYHSNRIGAEKYDVIAIHPYRYSPEAPDLDADAKLLFAVLKKHGYDDVPVAWSEMMHWGPFQIPLWGTESSSYVTLPNTWHGGILSYDMGWTEKKSAAWYARSYLVALRYSDRIINATSGNLRNNFKIDVMLTPYASQLIPNTLSSLLGDSSFKADIRFAPYVRAYVFEDGQKRPVAAVWGHLPKVDNGEMDFPYAEADFQDSLEGVFDLMNSPRAFNAGRFKFPVGTFPVFLRGKTGTLEKMVSALRNAELVSGEGISPIEIKLLPSGGAGCVITLKNHLSRPFSCALAGKTVMIPGGGTVSLDAVMPQRVASDRISSSGMKFKIKGSNGQEYSCDFKFEAFSICKIDDRIRALNEVNWSALPEIRIPYRLKNTETSGVFKTGWNRHGLALQVTVKDRKFVHKDYPSHAKRWKNDCLQFFFDTLADGRSKPGSGLDDNDYSYALFPAENGKRPFVWRYHVVDGQLGLGNMAPGPGTVADDISCSFANESGRLIYRVFVPARYLLPLRLQRGSSFGFGLFIPNSDVPDQLSGGLTTAPDGSSSSHCPSMWPLAVLE